MRLLRPTSAVMAGSTVPTLTFPVDLRNRAQRRDGTGTFSAVRVPGSSGLYRVDIRNLVSEWARQCGKRVSDRRVTLGVDRRHLAQFAGTTEPTIQRIENGHINPRDHLRFAISAVLGSDVSDLWSYPSYERIHDLLRAGA